MPSLDASTVKYRCPECEQLYGSTAALKVHLKSHTGELAFRCHHCGRHFEREEERLKEQEVGGKDGEHEQQEEEEHGKEPQEQQPPKNRG